MALCAPSGACQKRRRTPHLIILRRCCQAVCRTSCTACCSFKHTITRIPYVSQGSCVTQCFLWKNYFRFLLMPPACIVVIAIYLWQATEHDRVMKRKARFGTLTASPDSVSVAVCTAAFISCLLLNCAVGISRVCIVIVVRIPLVCCEFRSNNWASESKR